MTAVGESGPDGGPTVLVALANPRTERALVTLGAAVADHRDGRVLAMHVVTVPDQTPLAAVAGDRERFDEASERLLAAATEDAGALGVPVETTTVLSHRGLRQVFDAARAHEADAVVLGYGGARFAGGRAEGVLDEVAADLPCDVLVLDGDEVDPTDVLVPTAGGYSAALSAEVAVALRESFGAAVTLLYVADEGAEREGRAFLEEWAGDHGLPDADRHVETGDVEAAIACHAAAASLVVVGATGRGLLARVVRGSLTLDVLDDLETPVVMAERPDSRSLLERLLGRR